MGNFLKRHIFFYIILWFTATLLFSQEAEDDVISVNAEKIEQTMPLSKSGRLQMKTYENPGQKLSAML